MTITIPEGQVIKMTLTGNISPRLKKGQVVDVDAIKISHGSASGFSGRVVSVGYKTPCWLDMGWFKEFGRKRIRTVKR